MALTDLLYLCPLCGAGTREGTSGEATCLECETTFRPERRGASISVQPPDTPRTTVPIHELTSRLEALDPALRAARRGEKGILHQAEGSLRLATGQGVLRHRSGVLGFVEEFGEPLAGRLVLSSDCLTFTSVDSRQLEWPLAALSAVQAASSSIQLHRPDGPLASLRLLSDSTRRWEQLICASVRRVWRQEGRGDVYQFQPRIRAEVR